LFPLLLLLSRHLQSTLLSERVCGCVLHPHPHTHTHVCVDLSQIFFPPYRPKRLLLSIRDQLPSSTTMRGICYEALFPLR
jgi:hypothetical protein